jgi:hypothetical protein
MDVGSREGQRPPATSAPSTETHKGGTLSVLQLDVPACEPRDLLLWRMSSERCICPSHLDVPACEPRDLLRWRMSSERCICPSPAP